jgi:hypothetical protein
MTMAIRFCGMGARLCRPEGNASCTPSVVVVEASKVNVPRPSKVALAAPPVCGWLRIRHGGVRGGRIEENLVWNYSCSGGSLKDDCLNTKHRGRTPLYMSCGFSIHRFKHKGHYERQ